MQGLKSGVDFLIGFKSRIRVSKSGTFSSKVHTILLSPQTQT